MDNKEPRYENLPKSTRNKSSHLTLTNELYNNMFTGKLLFCLLYKT
jgi:hypothetical protein